MKEGFALKLLVLDGNSILNRAFYGIKLLTTKDGRFTNGIYGFLSILLRLRDECQPDGIAAAFDLRAPTFRHKMFDGYKAGRKPMPPELAQQMPVLKDLLRALGFAVVEQEGYEADDVLGTFARLCEQDDDWQCFIATGDRDALQLVSPETTVLLASTKMGKPVTTRYTPEKVREDYGVTPQQLIDVKALMGDSSDNIPGVAGVGQKTAGNLIARFGSIDAIYADLDALDIKTGVREKLRAGRDSAYLSRTLGTICREAPMNTDLTSYLYKTPDVRTVTQMLASLEMFKMIERLQLPAVEIPAVLDTPQRTLNVEDVYDYDACLAALCEAGDAYFDCIYDGGYIERLLLWSGDAVQTLTCGNMLFPAFMKSMLEDGTIRKHVTDTKPLYAYARRNGVTPKAVEDDLMLTGYILDPSAKDYSAAHLAQVYAVPLPECKDAAAAAVAVLPDLFGRMLLQIRENGQEKLLREVELPLARVLADMECCGFAVDPDGIERFGFRLDGTNLIIIDREIGIFTHDVHGVEVFSLVVAILEIDGRDSVVDEELRVAGDNVISRIAVGAFHEVGVFAGVALGVSETQLGDTHVLVVELEILLGRDGCGCLDPRAPGIPDDIGDEDVIGHKRAFNLGRFVSVMEIVAESQKQGLGHELVDVRNLLISVINGSIVLGVVFQAGAEQGESANQNQCSEYVLLHRSSAMEEVLALELKNYLANVWIYSLCSTKETLFFAFYCNELSIILLQQRFWTIVFRCR